MSQQTTEKIYNRSPRYVLQMKDKKIMRYAPFPRGNRAFFTEVVNLSETGMAFTVPFLDSPQIHEVIMVEFTPPGAEPIACFAKVQRVQNFSIIESDFFQKNCKLVAVQFTNLHEPQSKGLRAGLDYEFKKINNKFRRQQFWLKTQWYLKFKKKQLAMISIPVLATVAALTFFLLR